MKRVSLAAALLVCAAACTTAPTTNTTNTNASNTNAANSNAASSTAAWTDADVINGDKQAWDLIKSKSYDAFAALLDENFIDVTPEKVNNKAETVAFIKTLDLTEANLSDFKVVRVDNDAAIVTYTVKDKGTVGGKPIPADSPGMRHSTAKVWRGGKWHIVFHQSTLITPSIPIPPPSTAAANSNSANSNAANSNSAATTASPSTPATLSADAEANEKIVWDALKRKDWDAFASYLAEDQIEVWSNDVNDKAESVAGVKGFDFSTTTMSDFKTVPLDADAKVVTYMVKGTGPDKKPFTERASTVWANRNGKWLAVFHQGTEVAKPGR